MSSHTDATGFLLELRNEVSEDWFAYICDLAIDSNDSILPKNHLDKLASLFLGTDTYKPITTSSQSALPVSISTTSSSTIFLEELSGFANFKLLSEHLKVTFAKRISLIFGGTGAGKSSICKAIKILAHPDNPTSPLHNVRTRSSCPTAFSYKFRHETSPDKWDSTRGYGKYSESIKFFDSKVAIRRIKESLEPETVVEIAPFRLEVFSFCGAFTNALKEELTKRLEAFQTQINADIVGINQSFSGLLPVNEKAINDLSRNSHQILKAALTSYRPITEEEETNYQEIKATLSRLTQATTEQGLKLLQTEVAAMRELRSSIEQFHDYASKISLLDAQSLLNDLDAKSQTQQALSATIIPSGISIDLFKRFLEAATSVFNLSVSPDAVCPFCRKTLDEASMELIQQYHEFLSSTLESEIRSLQAKVNQAFQTLQIVKGFILKGFEVTGGMLSEEFKRGLTDCIISVKSALPVSIDKFKECDVAAYENYKHLKLFIDSLEKEITKRNDAINTATSNKVATDKEIARLKTSIQDHNYRQQFANSHEQLSAIVRKIDERNVIQQKIDQTDFPTLLRKLTNLGKDAHKQLVVQEFESILDKEYKALSAKGLAGYGIRLVSHGEQQIISVDPQIGDAPLERVLSEGEQKIHALALFFSELITNPSDIVVFDDPVTSFDYNYTATFAERLRDYIRDNPTSQAIIFTHNWDFFVQMQNVLNRSNLNNFLAVMVLENCDVLEEYKEDLDDLKCKAQTILDTDGNLTKAQKEKLSGIMRRMIETVINTHVFNGQRHQYKQKSITVSVFHDFVKLVPLLPQEADRLRDIYASLSVTEHDDVRNAYVNKSEALFQQWHKEIVDIEKDIISRRP
jgi:energy-coupling factor transporter ATP-binding protein EcfA2